MEDINWKKKADELWKMYGDLLAMWTELSQAHLELKQDLQRVNEDRGTALMYIRRLLSWPCGNHGICSPAAIVDCSICKSRIFLKRMDTEQEAKHDAHR